MVEQKIDRENLYFFAPDRYKYWFNITPFGPTNAPYLYTATMNFKCQHLLFLFDELVIFYHCYASYMEMLLKPLL